MHFLHYFIAHGRVKVTVISIIFTYKRHNTEEGSSALIRIRGEDSFYTELL